MNLAWSAGTGARSPINCSGQRLAMCVLVAVLHGLPAPAANAGRRCDQERSWPVHFRDATASDVLRVAVRGARCREAQLTIELATAEGKSLYRYRGPFRGHLENFFDVELAWAARKKVEDLHALAFGTTYAEFEGPHGLDYCTQEVPESVYRRFKREKRPLFHHSTGHEEWQYVVFDARRGQGVVVFTCNT